MEEAQLTINIQLETRELKLSIEEARAVLSVLKKLFEPTYTFKMTDKDWAYPSMTIDRINKPPNDQTPLD